MLVCEYRAFVYSVGFCLLNFVLNFKRVVAETILIIKIAFRGEFMGNTQITEFKYGRPSVDSDGKNKRNIERVWRRLIVWQLEYDLGIVKSSVWRILTKDDSLVREIHSKIAER